MDSKTASGVPIPFNPLDGGSLAVVAVGAHGSTILWCVGRAIETEADQLGTWDAEALGLEGDPAQPGIYVWDGHYVYRHGRDLDDVDSEVVGVWRSPTDAEWWFIQRNKCPWREVPREEPPTPDDPLPDWTNLFDKR